MGPGRHVERSQLTLKFGRIIDIGQQVRDRDQLAIIEKMPTKLA